MMRVIFRNSQGLIVDDFYVDNEELARQRAAELLLKTPIYSGDQLEFSDEEP